MSSPDEYIDHQDLGRRLVKAGRAGHTVEVVRLLDIGADIDFEHARQTALTAACGNGHLATAEVLLDASANPNALSGLALRKCIANADLRGLALLVEHKADIKPPSIMEAALTGNTLLLEYLYSHFDSSLKINSILHYAALPRHASVPEDTMENAVQLLLKSGARSQINNRSQKGRTPLMNCAESRNLGMMRALVRAGVDVHAADPSGKTALFYCRDYEPVLILIDAGANVDHFDNSGNNALHYALERGLLEIVELFLPNESASAPASGQGSAAPRRPERVPPRQQPCASLAQRGVCSTPACTARHILCDAHMRQFDSCTAADCTDVHPCQKVYFSCITCSICLDTCKDAPRRLPCSHVFHQECLDSLEALWCPYCRAPFSQADLRRDPVGRGATGRQRRGGARAMGGIPT